MKLGSFRHFFYDVFENKAFLTPEKRFRNDFRRCSTIRTLIEEISPKHGG